MVNKKEIFIRKSILTHGNKYDYSFVEYKTCDTKVLIRCKVHDYIFSQRPNHHVRGSGCPKCSKKYNYTTSEFIDKSILIHGDKYCYDKCNYINNNIKVIITCKIHGDFQQRPTHHINRRYGCPKCGNHPLSTNEFIEKSKKIFGDIFNYELVKYVDWKTKIKLICKKHNHIFSVTPNSHLSKNQGCPKCTMSKYELMLFNIFNKHNIKFEYQKKFDKCRGVKNKLPFDFYLQDFNTCIEFDGRQHFESIEKFGGLKNLEKTIYNDKLKDKYCESENIKLIRIHYSNNTKDKILDILKNNNII